MTAAILAVRPAPVPGIVSPEGAAELVRVFALERPPARRQLVCHWRRDADGRLTCVWEPDIVAVPQL
jgi:hypothetical protein